MSESERETTKEDEMKRQIHCTGFEVVFFFLPVFGA